MLICSLAATLSAGQAAFADEIGCFSIDDAEHWGFFVFPGASANNTVVTVPSFSGTVRRIFVEGTIKEVNDEAWVSSIRVQPEGAGLAGYQPGFQFSRQRSFDGTVDVSATIYAPGGVDFSGPIEFEMYSIDSEQFVPGLDATSNLTYSLDDSFGEGAVEYSGTLTADDLVYNRPQQFPSGSGFSAPFDIGANPFYDVQPFFVDTPGRYDLATATEFETAAAVYENSFDPSDPFANVLLTIGETRNVLRNDGFDDLAFGDDAQGGVLLEVELVPGVQYFHITTAAYGPNDGQDGGPFVGDYTNVLSGAGNVTLGLIPEPGVAFSLLSVGAIALRRRKS
ncbi:MAG: hypothetical protein AAF561_02690 [Planctomycetota bacterium]